MSSQILLQADDFGSHEAANVAILAAARAGTIKNIGVMAPGQAVPNMDETMQSLDVDWGLHVCLNSEWDRVKWGPLLPPDQVPTLVTTDGWFHSSPAHFHHYGVNLEEVESEVRAQYHRLISRGYRLTYLDEHMGVGWPRGIRAVLNRLAQEWGLIHVNARENNYIALANLATASHPAIVLCVTHPAEDHPDLTDWTHDGLAPDQVRKERAAEAKILNDPEFRQRIARYGHRIVRHSAVGVGL